MRDKKEGLSVGASILLAVCCFVAGSLSWAIAGPVPGRAQELKAEKPKAIDQHCKVVPDVLPINLESELKKLNAEGRTVNVENDFFLVGDKFTIVVCEYGTDDEGEDGP